MIKTLMVKMAEAVKDFFKEIYCAEVDNINNFYKQYR
jgi:hypothetical protein